MKNVNVYCYLKHGLLEKIKYTGYEIIDSVYTHYGDCTIFCKPYTRGIKVCIKASYVDDEYWNVTTGKLEHASGYSFYARLGNDGLWRNVHSNEELLDYLKEVSTYK